MIVLPTLLGLALKSYRKTLCLMVKVMFFCKCSLQLIRLITGTVTLKMDEAMEFRKK
jgi:hypothetical protein